MQHHLIQSKTFFGVDQKDIFSIMTILNNKQKKIIKSLAEKRH